jgi:DNA repair protein RadD
MIAAAPAVSPILRPYQTECIAAIRRTFAQWRRVLFILATGGGKTVIVAYIALHAAAKRNRVLILAHRQEIADQISAALTAMGVAHGGIHSEYAMTADLVQVGMVQTVARHLDVIPEPALLVIDECHHSVSNTYAKIVAAWPNAKVLGVTATPERLDGAGLGEMFDQMVLGPDVRELIDAGFLAPFRYLAPSTAIELSQVRSIGGDFNSADLERALDQDGITGDVVGHYLKYLVGRTAIAFCVTVAHTEHVAMQFRDNGIPAASIDGTMSAGQRHALVTKLRDGDIRVLTSCEIISEGFDAPAVGGAILLRPTQSLALYRQQVGRCLRRKPDGSAAVIIDHVGNVFRHGLPDAPHEWSLDSKKRTQAERQQAAVGRRMCKACEEVVATGAAVIAPPIVVPGILDEIDQMPGWAGGIDIRGARGREWYELIRRADRQPERLRTIQVMRGFKSGWLFYAARAGAA